MRVEFGENRSPGPSWSFILMQLRDESRYQFFDEELKGWLEKEWDIKLLHSNEMYPSHISGLEIGEQTVTMLMLKFPKEFVELR